MRLAPRLRAMLFLYIRPPPSVPPPSLSLYRTVIPIPSPSSPHTYRHSRPLTVIPAKAGIHTSLLFARRIVPTAPTGVLDSGLRRNDGGGGGRGWWCSAFLPHPTLSCWERALRLAPHFGAMLFLIYTPAAIRSPAIIPIIPTVIPPYLPSFPHIYRHSRRTCRHSFIPTVIPALPIVILAKAGIHTRPLFARRIVPTVSAGVLDSGLRQNDGGGVTGCWGWSYPISLLELDGGGLIRD